MNSLNLAISFLQNNWALILIIAAGVITLLVAIANFRVRWAATTPEKTDDVEAKVFKKRVNVIILFIKDLFRLNKKVDGEKDDSKN